MVEPVQGSPESSKCSVVGAAFVRVINGKGGYPSRGSLDLHRRSTWLRGGLKTV